MPQHNPLEFGENPFVSPELNQARTQYVDQLEAFRYQLHMGPRKPDDFALLDKQAETYVASYCGHLLGICALAGEDVAPVAGKITSDEIVRRRAEIATRFHKYPVHLYPSTEIVIGGSSTFGAVENAVLGHIPSAIGSAILTVTSYLSYKYRKEAAVNQGVIDSKLVADAVSRLEQTEGTPPELCMLILEATIDSEKAAVTRMAAQYLRAKVFTPLGYFRLFVYNHSRKRSQKKRQGAEG